MYVVTMFVVVMLIMVFHYTVLVDPLFTALECTCLSQGSACREANRFNYEFWHGYWKVDTPNVFKEIDQLKSRVSFQSQGTAPGSAAKEGLTGKFIRSINRKAPRQRPAKLSVDGLRK